MFCAQLSMGSKVSLQCVDEQTAEFHTPSLTPSWYGYLRVPAEPPTHPFVFQDPPPNNTLMLATVGLPGSSFCVSREEF